MHKAVFPVELRDTIKQINKTEWSSNIKFWPYDEEGEIDARIEFDDVVIGIEVKFKSGISSDDGADYSKIEEHENEIFKSSHQLQREARIISKKGKDKIKILLFVADMISCANIYADVQKRKLLNDYNIKFGYITWQSFLNELCKLKSSNPFYNIVFNDLCALLRKKGFEQFESMELKEEIFVDRLLYFIFNYTFNKYFDFRISIYVKEGLFYEFR